ncbi:hypothetical protein [Promicromonospora sp. NPDC050880]|uniref:hypothetical protein n=1 Tax=Promicromonospora sp. NPDC050880 TaxID=3364406 RepID=UPI0037B4997E
MNVHDINAKRDAAMLAGLRAASTTIEPPRSLDPTTMAVRAVRNVRRRRVLTAVTAGAAALAVLGAGIGVAGSVLADRQEPVPGTDRTTAQPTPASAPPSRGSGQSASPSAVPVPEPTRYLRTGDGELPVLPGVERGVVEGDGATPYILGGLWYEVPAGGWYAVGDVNAGGVAGFLAPEDPRANGSLDMSIDDVDAALELRNVTDVAGWTVPARDSGATTLDIEGADLVVIERHAREGAVAPATIRIRSGAEGWIIETRFPAGAEGDTMLRDFVGNLWLEEAGEPDWYAPAYEHPTLEPLEHGIPAGWQRTEHNGLTFGVPEGWTAEPTEGEFSPGVEWAATTAREGVPGERVYVQGGKPGGNWWTRTMAAPESQVIDVPGADYAEVQPTLYNAAGEPETYSVSIYVHQADRGENLFLVADFDGSEQGWRDLHTFLGTLDFRR